ncbi:MAG: hypothetical protein QG672_2898 [Pseudomonadota bacterium]|nr:hypothetical protein [Pseudomonadota bacterium]
MSSDDIVSRADSLMRRRRSFVATTTASAGEPLLSAEPMAIEVEEDIPVLTEEVLPETPTAGAPRNKFDEKLASRLASEFAHSLECRLTAELPTLVEASLAILEADLRRGILDIANDAIKDFVARRQQLQLPLEAPDSENE